MLLNTAEMHLYYIPAFSSLLITIPLSFLATRLHAQEQGDTAPKTWVELA